MLTYDQDHWNRTHPGEQQVELPMDLSFDIELRKNTPEEEGNAA